MVGRGAAAAGPFEEEADLLADAGLADDVVEFAGADAGFGEAVELGGLGGGEGRAPLLGGVLGFFRVVEGRAVVRHCLSLPEESDGLLEERGHVGAVGALGVELLDGGVGLLGPTSRAPGVPD